MASAAVAGRIACVCAVAACGRAGASAGGLRELAAALESAPGVAPRLSVVSTFRACEERAPEGGTIPRANCPVRRPANAARLARIAVRAAAHADDPASLQTVALVKLVTDDGRGVELDSAIALLRRAAELADQPAPMLGDLAAALLVRAERAQSARDLLEAYETAETALRHQPRNPTALYNRALALDRFGLVDETARAWRAYRAVDSTSGWAAEAKRRLHAALSVSLPPPPADDAAPGAYAAWAAADPQGARELGMNRLLGQWGAATAAGDTARAADRLRRAEALGSALERRPGGDASMGDAVRAIRAAAGDPSATRALAAAHHDYAAAQASLEKLDYAGAEPRLAAAEAAAGASPVLRAWCRLSLGVVRNQPGKDGARLFRQAAAEADSVRHPVLAARVRWALARTTGQGEHWETALEEAQASARLFARAGERENEGVLLGMLVEIRSVVGEADSAYADLHRSLDRLKPYRTSFRLHNELLVAARAVATDGLLGSALRIQAEGVGVATRTRNPAFAAEARLERARLLAARGDFTRARADVDTARGLVASLESEDARRWFAADLREAEGFVSLTADPTGATRALDSAAAGFLRVAGPFRALPALVGSAQARLAARDAPGAARRLESAVRLLEQRRASIRMEPRRAAVFDAARGVVDRIVLLKLADGATAQALDYMDRARASLAPAGGAGESGGVEPLPGETAVEYARVADTLLVWTVSARGVALSRVVLDTVRLVHALETLEYQLEHGAGEAEVRPALSLLYDWLVRPVEARLGPGTPLVVVADGEIAAVPFAALYDRRRGCYLVQDRALRFAVSLREARRPATEHPAGGVLLVADPAFDLRENPLLDRLPHARQEVGAIAASYPGAGRLEGAAATRVSLESALGRAGILHFAGHAVFDDQRPERSYLVLARAAGSPAAGKLTAAELAGLDLHRVRLVVLSACRTVRSGHSRAGGFSGLAGALLVAGAGGAVGSTWDVDDVPTAALMAAFHRQYARRGDAPGALREAQLALLASPRAALRSPSAWAGFRYAGR